MTDIDRDKLLAYVLARLQDDREDDRAYSDSHDPHLTMRPEATPLIHAQFMYDAAKDSARRGDFAPLLKILVARDPDLAGLITGKKQKRVRRKSQLGKSKEYWEKRDRADAIKRIRKLIEEKIKAPSHDLVKDIAAEILNCDPEIISKIIHRGTPR